MIFVVSFVSLMIERFFDWAHLRQWHWLQQLQAMIVERLPVLPAYAVLLLSTLPVVIVAFLIGCLLKGAIYGLALLIWQVMLLLLSFGPKNLWAQNFLNVSVEQEVQATQEPADLVLVKANQRVLAPLFWFILLGPCGALFYRMVSVSKEVQSSALQQAAAQLEALMSWLPVRLFSLIFALGGNFSRTIEFWVKHIKQSPAENQRFIVGCGYAALSIEDNQVDQVDAKKTQSVLGLIDRVLVITLILLVISTLAA